MVIYNPYTKKTHPSPPPPVGRNNNNKRPRPPEELPTTKSSRSSSVDENNINDAKHDQCHQQNHRNIVRANTHQRDPTMSNLHLSKQAFTTSPSVSSVSTTPFSQPMPSSVNANAQQRNNPYHRSSKTTCTSLIHNNSNNSISTVMSQPITIRPRDSQISDSARSMAQPQQQPKNPYLLTPKSSTNNTTSGIRNKATTNTTPGCITNMCPTRNPYRQQSPAATTSAFASNTNGLRVVGSTTASAPQPNSENSLRSAAQTSATLLCATKAMTANAMTTATMRTSQFRSDIFGSNRNGSTPTSKSVSSASFVLQTSNNHVLKRPPPLIDTHTTTTTKTPPINIYNGNGMSTNQKTSATTTTTTTTGHSCRTAETTATAIGSLRTTTIDSFVPIKEKMQFPSDVATTAVPLKTGENRATITTTRQAKGSAVASIRPSSWMNKHHSASTDLNRKATPGHTKNGTVEGEGGGAGIMACSRNSRSNNDNKKQAELPGEASLPKQLKYNPEQMRPIDDGYRKILVENAEVSKPLLNGWTLYNHQKRAIIQGLVRRRIILALDMGLGKTLIGCVWSKAFKETFKDLKILVICPVSLKEEWKRTAENATGLSVEWGKKKESSSKKSKKKEEENEAKAQSSSSYLDLQIYSWAKVPTEVDSRVKKFVAVFDEAHSMQSMDSTRTQNSLKLIDSERCVGVLLLTGTPMKNGKPCNLFPLLKAVRHPLGGHQRAYEAHFCNGTERLMNKKRLWDASGCSNLKQLNRMVSTNLLHLTKEQCLDELPPLTREKRQVPISSRNQIEYIRAVKALELVDHRKKAGNLKDDQQEAVLGAIQRLRVLCANAKIRATVEYTKDILEKEPAVVIFSNFAKVAEQVHKQLANSGWEGELLTGDTLQNKRQGMVDKFQEGLSPVFVCTFGAGGVGLTLTAASTIILLDRPWTSGDTRQAEDRVRRIGQDKPVKSIWMTAFDLDTQIDAIIESKVQVTNAVLGSRGGGGSGTTQEKYEGFCGEVTKINVSKLAASLIGNINNLPS